MAARPRYAVPSAPPAVILLIVATGVATREPTRAAPDTATGACADVRIHTVPARPRAGALFRVRLVGVPDDAELRGTAAGEPLHLTRSSGTREALAGAPIERDSPLRIDVVCTIAGRSDSLSAAVALAAADYPVERLRVAPRYAAPPDSALAARMARESAIAADVSRGSHETPRLWSAPFLRPRESRVTSTFGRGRQFNGAVTSRHLGTDYAGGVGAPVRAANRGIVRVVDAFFLGGNVVYLDHGAGLVTAYLHLSRQDVAVGDTVARGAVIGRVGATGRVTGPHLHWITRYGAVTVDPASVLALTAGSGAR